MTEDLKCIVSKTHHRIRNLLLERLLSDATTAVANSSVLKLVLHHGLPRSRKTETSCKSDE